MTTEPSEQYHRDRRNYALGAGITALWWLVDEITLPGIGKLSTIENLTIVPLVLLTYLGVRFRFALNQQAPNVAASRMVVLEYEFCHFAAGCAVVVFIWLSLLPSCLNLDNGIQPEGVITRGQLIRDASQLALFAVFLHAFRQLLYAQSFKIFWKVALTYVPPLILVLLIMFLMPKFDSMCLVQRPEVSSMVMAAFMWGWLLPTFLLLTTRVLIAVATLK